MSNNYYLHFKNAKTKIDVAFFERIARWLVKKGFKYLSFWSAGDEIPISFDYAIRKLPEGGRISFKVGENDVSLDYFNEIALVTHPVNFEKNNFFTDLFIEAMVYLYLELKADKAYGVIIDYTSTDEEESARHFEHYVSCFNIFNPEIAEKISREKLVQVNAYKAEYLKDGLLFLVLYENPRNVSGEKMENVRRQLFG